MSVGVWVPRPLIDASAADYLSPGFCERRRIGRGLFVTRFTLGTSDNETTILQMVTMLRAYSLSLLSEAHPLGSFTGGTYPGCKDRRNSCNWPITSGLGVIIYCDHSW